MMKIYKYLAISAVFLLASSNFAIAEDKANKMASVELYGQEFSAKEQAVIRSVVPSMFDGADQNVKDVLSTLGQAVGAQRSEYEGGLSQLAEFLESNGYLPAMFMRPNEDGYLSINFKDPIYTEMAQGPKENRVNYIKGEVEFWIMQGGWRDKVSTFNSIGEGHLPALDDQIIAQVAQQYETYKAVHKMDIAVRQSPEVQGAGLGRYGIIEPEPVEVDAGRQDPAAPSWMGNANDGVSP